MLPSAERLVAARLGAFGDLLASGALDLLLPRVERLPLARRGAPSVGVGPGLRAALDRGWPTLGVPPAAPPSAPARRRALRLAQADAGLDPVALLGWLESGAGALGDQLADLFSVVLEAETSGAGGEELALFACCALVDHLEAEVAARGGGEAMRALVELLLVDAATRAVEAAEPEHGDGRGEGRGARLGRALALLVSPVALGADPNLAERPVHPYRTIPAAYRLARRVIEPPVEPMRLGPIVETLTERLLVGEEERRALERAERLEAVRDAALALRGLEGRAEARELTYDPRALVAAVYAEPRRARLLDLLAPLPGRSAAALRERIEAAREPLPETRLRARARLAAVGGLVLRLDEVLRDLRREARRGWRSTGDPAEHRRGEGVWLELGAPLVVPARSSERALVLLCVFGSPLEGPGDERLARAVEQFVLQPAAARLEAGGRRGLRRTRRDPDRVAAHGPLDAVLELALAWAELRSRAEPQLEASLPPAPDRRELEEAGPPSEAELDAWALATSPPRLRLPIGIGIAFGPAPEEPGLGPLWTRAAARAETTRGWAADVLERRRVGLEATPPRLAAVGDPPGPVLGEDVLDGLARERALALSRERSGAGPARAPVHRLEGLPAHAGPVRLRPFRAHLWVLTGEEGTER